jgi:hypothetical protein
MKKGKENFSLEMFVNIVLLGILLCGVLSACARQNGQSFLGSIGLERTNTETPTLTPTYTPTLTATLTPTQTPTITPSPTITLTPTGTQVPPLVLTRDFPLDKENWRDLFPQMTEEDITSGRWAEASERLNQEFPVIRKFDYNHYWKASPEDSMVYGEYSWGWGILFNTINIQYNRLPAFGDSISWISNFRGSGKDYLVVGMRYVDADGKQMSIPIILPEGNIGIMEHIYGHMGFSKENDKLLLNDEICGTNLFWPVTAVNKKGVFYSDVGDEVIATYYEETKQVRKDLVKKFLKKSVFVEGMDRLLWAALAVG